MDWLNNFLTFCSVVIFISVSLSCISNKWDYRVKITFMYITFFISSLIVIPHAWLAGNPYNSAKFWGRILLPVSTWLGLKWTIKGQEHINPKRSYVVVCNHQSAIDVLATTQIWSLFDQCAVVAKKELKYAGPFGYAIAVCGAIFVDRASSEAGRKAINEAGKKAKDSGISLFIFPEGTRNRSGGLMPFKKGAFHVALDIGAPILPVVVSEYTFLGPNRNDQFPGGDITIQFLPPIETEGFSKDEVDDLITKTREPMEQVLSSFGK